MSTTPPSRNGTDAGPKQPLKISRQRFKPQLSCTFCRHRKLRCDRSLPCQNCTKRDLSASCTFIHAGIRHDKASTIHKAVPNGNSREVQSQISRLEELVVSLMHKTSANGGHVSEGEDVDGRWMEGVRNAEEGLGRIDIGEQMSYVGSTHWAAILDNIACLKDKFEHGEPFEDKRPLLTSNGPDLLVGGVRKASRTEILAAVPHRSIADHLFYGYLECSDMGATMFHAATVKREYELFWDDPTRTPIMWIGMMFGIFALTTHFENMTGESSMSESSDLALRDQVEAVNIFRKKTVQCLVLGNYSEPGPYTIETLLLYYISEHLRCADAQFGSFLVFGIIVRTAMRLGLHRDASHYPRISVFQGEMQRRRWASIVHLDLQTSLQVGLPRMIKDGMYDTEAPRNLLDIDFDDKVTELPPARPEGELIPIGYSNIKHRITRVFGTIVDQANSTDSISYEAALTLDKLLHETHQQTPDILKVRNIEDLNIGTVETRVRKFSVELTFQKARCVLHRKFFIFSKVTATYPYPYSMKACIEAAMRILECQIYMDTESRPGNVLHSQRWKASSLITHDYLLAAMLICLHLGHFVGLSPANQNIQADLRTKWTRDQMLRTLHESYRIFDDSRHTSRDALEAAKALRGLLAQFEPNVMSNDGRRAMIPDMAKTTPTPVFNMETQMSHIQKSTTWVDTTSCVDQTTALNMSSGHQARVIADIPIAAQLDWNPANKYIFQERWDNHFYSNSFSETAPDLWNFSPNAYPGTIMDWDNL